MSISSMESGVIAPKFSRLPDIANALACSVNDFAVFWLRYRYFRYMKAACLICVK